ncbi:hypothetical protein [Lactococcus lactis]|jgi:surface protein|uniref:hypothetical protein n=1 Tax=Lactococcus lactis TaxID=1358 RepID=UPI002416EECA|nr:hypothetical protein [Lactococcus lactis]MDG4970037.1 BspA family leucine-rich repeat surface protein [Lactococcus lactis]MDG5103892.1 BspA family leucine-rich repeat surface protein [Lactococcus lactis]
MELYTFRVVRLIILEFLPILLEGLQSRTVEGKKIVFDGPLAISGSAESLFTLLHNVTEFSGFNNLNTTNVTSMNNMFGNMTSLTNLDLSTMDNRNVLV